MANQNKTTKGLHALSNTIWGIWWFIFVAHLLCFCDFFESSTAKIQPVNVIGVTALFCQHFTIVDVKVTKLKTKFQLLFWMTVLVLYPHIFLFYIPLAKRYKIENSAIFYQEKGNPLQLQCGWICYSDFVNLFWSWGYFRQ